MASNLIPFPGARQPWAPSDTIHVPAGAWIRERLLPRATSRSRTPRSEPTWSGAWHLAVGDVVVYLHNNRKARVACGHMLRASIDRDYEGQAYGDVVVADEMPLVDVCLRCVRLSGAKVAIAVREREVTITPTA